MKKKKSKCPLRFSKLSSKLQFTEACKVSERNYCNDNNFVFLFELVMF